MRLLFWCATFLPYLGGVEVLGSRLIAALRDRGYEVLVVTRQDSLDLPRDDEIGGIPIRRFPIRQVLNDGDPEGVLEERRRVAVLKRDFQPDLINIYHPGGPDMYFHITTQSAVQAPELAFVHFPPPPDMLRPGAVMRRWLEASTWVAACSAATLAETRREVPEIVSRSSVLYGSLPLPSITPRSPTFDPPRLLCVGRVDRVKGFDVALEAFRSVLLRFPEARLIIVGDGPARPALERQAADLGVMSHVMFMGWVSPDRVPALMNDTSVVVMPSREEPFGLVALQAAQMQRPIVASRVGGLPEIVSHEETGLLVPPEDSRAVAEAIATLLDRPDWASRLGRAAQRLVEQRFTWDHHVDAYDKLCRTLVNGGTPNDTR